MLGASTSTLSAARAGDFAGSRRSPEGGQCITTIVWDSRDRLVEVKVNGTSVARYGYDTQNLRVYVNDAQGERRVLLDGIEELMELEAGAMSQVARWDRDPSVVDALLAQAAGTKAHAVTDALGSVYGLVDANGNVQARYSYEVWGARSPSTETVPTPWGYTGRRHDPVDLVYHRYRYASDGRFVARDRRLVTLSENLYAYTLGDPVSFSDPSGRYVYAVDGRSIGAIYNPKRKSGVLDPYDFSVGLTATPTGNSVFQEVASAPHFVSVTALYSRSDLYSELIAAPGYQGDEAFIREVSTGASSALGDTFAVPSGCGPVGPLWSFRVYWFPNSIVSDARTPFFQRDRLARRLGA